MSKIAKIILECVFLAGLVVTAILGWLEIIIPQARRVLQLLGI